MPGPAGAARPASTANDQRTKGVLQSNLFITGRSLQPLRNKWALKIRPQKMYSMLMHLKCIIQYVSLNIVASFNNSFTIFRFSMF